MNVADAPRPVWHRVAGPLSAEAASPRRARRVVFVHGFTQTGNSWKPIAERLWHEGFGVVVVDLPGHGGSSQVRSDLRATADALAATGGRAAYVGYSLGGRACLHLALSYPHLVTRLALVGAHPGIDDELERARRRQSDDAVAERMRTVGLDAFLDEWSAQPLFGGFVLPAAERADRRRNTVEGLASSLALAGTGTQTSLWPRLRELAMPVLAMAGDLDPKFTDIGRQLTAEVTDGRYVAIADAAHAAHLQQPAAVSTALADFLRR